MTKSIIQLQNSPGYHLTVLNSIQLSFNIFVESIGGLFLPSSTRLGFVIPIIGVILLLRSKKSIAKKLLPIWFFTPIVLLIATRHDVLEQFFVYAIIPGILLNTFVWEYIILWKKHIGWIVFGLVICFYVSVWLKTVPSDSQMFYESTQPDINIHDENIVIDRIYKQMGGRNFSFQSYTIPYWYQQGWEYLFWQRGLQKYGYMPVTANGKTLFVIVQDDPNGKHYQDDWLKNTVSTWGTQTGYFRQGVFTVLVLKVK